MKIKLKFFIDEDCYNTNTNTNTHTYIYIRENISSQSNILLTIFYRQHEIYINAIMKLRKKNAK